MNSYRSGLLVGPKTNDATPEPLIPMSKPKRYIHSGKKPKCRINGYGCLSGTVIFALVLSLGVALLSAFALSYALYPITNTIYTSNAAIQNSPLVGHIDSSVALTLTLPNDLSEFVGRTFTFYSRSAHPHVIQIQGGTLTTSWDGVNTVATFGGAKGDGLVFHVFDRNQIAVISNTNVVFS
jgi:hypothetical protein